jgi:hypothetical protein
MDKLQKDKLKVLHTQLANLTETLYHDQEFTIEMFLNAMLFIISSDTFKKVSKQDLLEDFITKEAIIPIA